MVGEYIVLHLVVIVMMVMGKRSEPIFMMLFMVINSINVDCDEGMWHLEARTFGM
jgi:hypothetical protein